MPNRMPHETTTTWSRSRAPISRPSQAWLACWVGSHRLDDAVKQSACSIDATERRLIDFKLPDLSGKMVSLHDIDADVILLDFWGSWCQPCRKSIPHLIELQKKFAGKRFQVVGIACEKAAAAARPAGQCGQSREGARDQLSRAPLGPRRNLPPAAGTSGSVLSHDGPRSAVTVSCWHASTAPPTSTLPRMDRAIASALRGQAGAGQQFEARSSVPLSPFAPEGPTSARASPDLALRAVSRSGLLPVSFLRIEVPIEVNPEDP